MKLGVRRTAWSLAAALLPLLAVACADEERTLNVHGQFSVVRETGATGTVVMENRIHDAQMGEESFRQAWSVVTRGARPYEALAITVTSSGTGDGNPVPMLAGLVLALPTPLRAGARYPIGRAFPPPSLEMPMYWRVWGGYDLREAGVAEISLRTFDYHTVGMRIENEFIATSAAGFIEVLERGGDYVELRIDLTAVNAQGQQVRWQGDLGIRAEKYRPPIT